MTKNVSVIVWINCVDWNFGENEIQFKVLVSEKKRKKKIIGRKIGTNENIVILY